MARCGNCSASVSEYSSTCPSCGATFNNSRTMGTGLLAFFTVILLIYMPFVFLGFGVGIYSWLVLEISPIISAAMGVGSFALGLILVRLIGRIADKIKPLLIVEYILAVGIQFLVIFSIAFGAFTPKEVQMDLALKQVDFIQQTGFMGEGKMDATMEYIQGFQEQMEAGDIDIKALTKGLRSQYSFKDSLQMGLKSNLNYMKNTLAQLKGAKAGEMSTGLLASLGIALIGSFLIWRIYKRKLR